MIVVDASVLVMVLADDGPTGRRYRRRLAGETAVAPELVDLEVLSVLRRSVRAGRLSEQRAAIAVDTLPKCGVARAPHEPLVGRCWELRDNLSPYDAVYVALAERLGAVLLTADRRLAAAPGARCEVEVL